MADLRVRGRVLTRDPGVDLALVQLDSLPDGMEELPLAADAARPGDRVHVVGCRYDVDSLWAHSVSAVRQALTLKEGYFSGGKEFGKGRVSYRRPCRSTRVTAAARWSTSAARWSASPRRWPGRRRGPACSSTPPRSALWRT